MKFYDEPALSAPFGDRRDILVRSYDEAADVRSENADVRKFPAEFGDDLPKDRTRGVKIV